MVDTRRNTRRTQGEYYSIKHELFWTVLLGVSIPLLSTTFYLGHVIGSTRFDISTNEIRETNKVLQDSLKLQRKTMERMRSISDSAHNILGYMPYDQMKLDTAEFRKVQSNIEAAGAALHLNATLKP